MRFPGTNLCLPRKKRASELVYVHTARWCDDSCDPGQPQRASSRVSADADYLGEELLGGERQ